jgi:hypothetical protein
MCGNIFEKIVILSCSLKEGISINPNKVTIEGERRN